MNTLQDTTTTNDLATRKTGVDMNEALREIAIQAGAPEDMMESLWFNIFCQRFAHMILMAAEEELK